MDIQELYFLIQQERDRQNNNIELIASENYASQDILNIQGSILTNKYAEGYPSKRYYGGCEHVDKIETAAIELAKKLFNVKFANVQPHSGSAANMAVYRVLLSPGDTVMGLALDHGGHLTHGHRMSFSGVDYNFIPYYLNQETELLDFEEIFNIAKETKPKLIIAGTSAYSRSIDFSKFKEIAESVGAKLMVDMAHISGLVAAGVHMNPCDYADVVTSTTHKTLRGPRGGIILTNDENLAKKINTMIFPGIQGGPLMHIIAAKAACFIEAMNPSFKEYQKQVIKNAQTMVEQFIFAGYKVVSGGTDNHLFTINVKQKTGISGKVAEEILDKVNITVNKNTIPYDSEPPFITSGIRIGTPAITTIGFKEEEVKQVAQWIIQALESNENLNTLNTIQEEIQNFMHKRKE